MQPQHAKDIANRETGIGTSLMDRMSSRGANFIKSSQMTPQNRMLGSLMFALLKTYQQLVRSSWQNDWG
jgi:hypothetical protein